MLSIAPVASATPIIWVTMLGNTPHSLRGSTMVRPSSMAFRTFIRASSSTALPEVLAVIAKPSRIGTPEVISVPRVQVEQHFVEVIAAPGMLTDVLDAEDHAHHGRDEDPPETLHECAQSHDDTSGKRQGDAQAG